MKEDIEIYDMKALVSKITNDVFTSWLGRSVEEVLIRLKPYGINIILPTKYKGRMINVNDLTEIKLICKNKKSKFYNQITIIK